MTVRKLAWLSALIGTALAVGGGLVAVIGPAVTTGRAQETLVIIGFILVLTSLLPFGATFFAYRELRRRKRFKIQR